MLVGQFSVGWANDALDADRDRRSGRPDKPLATGLLAPRTVFWAARAALILDIPLSLAVGWRAGAAHLIAVGSAWLYDAGLKATRASVIPYLVSFGLLPVAIAAALPGAPSPQALIAIAGACAGIAAHFANTVGDAADDAATGVHGLPQHLGESRSLLVSALGIAAAATALLIAVGASAFTLSACAVSIGCAFATLPAIRLASGRAVAFRLVLLAVAALVVAFVGAGGRQLTG